MRSFSRCFASSLVPLMLLIAGSPVLTDDEPTNPEAVTFDVAYDSSPAAAELLDVAQVAISCAVLDAVSCAAVPPAEMEEVSRVVPSEDRVLRLTTDRLSGVSVRMQPPAQLLMRSHARPNARSRLSRST